MYMKILNIISELPKEADPPHITNFTIDDFSPVVIINISSFTEGNFLSAATIFRWFRLFFVSNSGKK